MRFQQPPFLPAELADAHVSCSACNRIVRPDIWERFDQPFGPVYPDPPDPSGGFWQRLSISMNCACGHTVEFEIKPTKLTHVVHFFGDEAERDTPNWIIECYCLIGGTSGTVGQIERSFQAAKANLLPSIDPERWRVHLKDIFPGNARIKHPRFSQLSQAQVMKFVEEVASVIKEADQFTWNTVVFGFREKPSKSEAKKSRKDAMSVMHLALLSSAIFRTTAQGLKPKFTLDAQKTIRQLPHIEGWSRETFLGSRHYLASELLTHGNEIDPPEFAYPGSLIGLEIADFFAYFVARNLLHKHQSKETELPLTKLGRCYYMAMIDANKVDYFVGEDIVPKYIPQH
ncbi:MAG: hypothetical protein ACK4MQ_07135 [Hyphomonas sp.]